MIEAIVDISIRFDDANWFINIYTFSPSLPASTHLTPATTTFLQADTQSSPLLRSTCPNHLNLPRFTTSATLSAPKRLYKSTLGFLPRHPAYPSHHHSFRPLQASQICILHRPVPYVNTLWIQALYIFPLLQYDAKQSRSAIECSKMSCRLGLRPRTGWGSLRRSPRPPSCWRRGERRGGNVTNFNLVAPMPSKKINGPKTKKVGNHWSMRNWIKSEAIIIVSSILQQVHVSAIGR